MTDFVDFADFTGISINNKPKITKAPKKEKKKEEDSKYITSNGNKIIYDNQTMQYYRVLRARKMDPLFNQELNDTNGFKYKYQWDPYTGEILIKNLRHGSLEKESVLAVEDPYGPLYFHPDNLIKYYHTNRLRNLWEDGSDEANGYFEGRYDDLVGIGEEFHIQSRGNFPERYLFRLPITDCYLTKDHEEKFITLGPKLTDEDAKEIDRLAALWGDSYRQQYGKHRPSLVIMKKLYDTAINGESRTISVTFPEEYGNKDLAGKAATFDITAKKLSRPVVPAVDDELAKKLAFDDLAELRRSWASASSANTMRCPASG